MARTRKNITFTKRELKQDKFVTFYLKAVDFFQTNTQYVASAFSGLAIVIVLTVLLRNYFTGQEEKSATALGKAEIVYAQGNYLQAIPELETIVDNYGNTSSGNVATFYLANSYFFTNDTLNAIKHFEKYADDGESDLLKPSALAGLAACYEWQQNYQNAAKFYQKAADDYSDHFDAPSYYVNAGRCYNILGNKDKARELFEKVINDYPTSSAVQDAELLKAEL